MTWATIPLRRIVECLDGRRVPLNRGQRSELGGAVPYWGAGGVLDHVNRGIFDEPLVLLGEDGAPFFSPGKDVAYFVDGPTWVNNHIHVLRTRHVDPSFLRHALNCVDYSRYITGSTRDKLTQGDMMAIEIPHPPLEEQRRIADFLDTQTTLIDKLVQQRTRQCEVLDELTRREIDDIVNQRQASATVRLGYLALVQTGVTVDGNRRHDENVVTLPYLRVANVQAGYVDLGDIRHITVPRNVAAVTRLRAGDVLMTEGGDLDKLGRGTVWHGEIEDCLHQNHVFAIRPDMNVLTPDYLALFTRTSMARRYFESTGNKTTNLASTSSSKIRDFRIPLAGIDAQSAGVKEADTRLRSISQLKDQIAQQLTLLAERRRAMITAAVTGQIGVTTARRASPVGRVSA